MKISKWSVISIVLSLLFLSSNIANAEYKTFTNKEQNTKQQKREEKQEKKEMKQKGMKKKVKSYGEVVLEQAEILGLTDEQLGKIMRIQMTNKKLRKGLLDQPHKSMEKALKELRNPATNEALIRKAGRAHTDDFDALVDAEIKVRNRIDAALTANQKMKLKTIKLPKEENSNE